MNSVVTPVHPLFVAKITDVDGRPIDETTHGRRLPGLGPMSRGRRSRRPAMLMMPHQGTAVVIQHPTRLIAGKRMHEHDMVIKSLENVLTIVEDEVIVGDGHLARPGRLLKASATRAGPIRNGKIAAIGLDAILSIAPVLAGVRDQEATKLEIWQAKSIAPICSTVV